MFVRSDKSLFRNLTTLGQKAGVPRNRLARLVLKELTDNALDAGATCRVGELERGAFFVEDDGPGIDGTDEEIANLFSFGRDLTSSKLFRLPTRGALGNGLRVVAGAVYASRGSLQVTTSGRCLDLVPQENGTTEVAASKKSKNKGTRIELQLGADLADDREPLVLAKLSIAICGNTTYKGKTSAYWYGDEDFFELLQAFDGTVRDLAGYFENGPKAATTAWSTAANTLDRDQAMSLLQKLRACSKPVQPGRLGIVGEEALRIDGYSKVVGEFKLPSAYSTSAQLPFVVEVGATRRKAEDDPKVLFFVNRTVVTAPADIYIIKAYTNIHGCGIEHRIKTGRAPMSYIVNVQTPYMPITTDGKEPDFGPLADPIMTAIQKAARRAQRATASSNPGLSKKDVVRGVLERAIARASGNNRHRFSLRQLYYKVRPLFEEQTGMNDLDYNHFASIITDYEQMIGHDVPKMYRDARGTLYHPHTGETIPLGTLNVEKYQRPEWTFNKVLYCEKEGFFPLLLDEQWAEKHDCALLTSKGFASRAARDVIDLLGDSDEELLFFAIHDSDGPGTKILEALQEATAARPARRVRIVDLGLNPWEAEEMDLVYETFERKGNGRVPVAEYVRDHVRGDHWERWLQTKRVELNAMSSPEFLEWLDKKMAEHDQGKVIPPDQVLDEKLDEAVAKEVRTLVVDKILRETKADDQIKKAIARVPDLATASLRKQIERELHKKPVEQWVAPLGRIAVKQAARGVK